MNLVDRNMAELLIRYYFFSKKRNIFSNALSMQISSADKALRSGHDAIRAVASRIGLTKKVTDRAFLTYKICHEKKCLRGRSQDVIVATCIYVACREEGSTRTIDGKYKIFI